jgi:hypothetical protein
MMDQQHDFLFFRIPRELRDEIYHHYLWEENGSAHHAPSGTLRTIPSETFELSLNYMAHSKALNLDLSYT